MNTITKSILGLTLGAIVSVGFAADENAAAAAEGKEVKLAETPAAVQTALATVGKVASIRQVEGKGYKVKTEDGKIIWVNDKGEIQKEAGKKDAPAAK